MGGSGGGPFPGVRPIPGARRAVYPPPIRQSHKGFPLGVVLSGVCCGAGGPKGLSVPRFGDAHCPAFGGVWTPLSKPWLAFQSRGSGSEPRL